MSNIALWWCSRSEGEKIALGVVGGMAILVTGGVAAYAIASGGIAVASGETVILIGAATSMLKRRA